MCSNCLAYARSSSAEDFNRVLDLLEAFVIPAVTD